MKPTLPPRRRAAEKAGAILEIGMQCFHFASGTDAAKAFALLSKSVYVRRNYGIGKDAPEHFYTPDHLIGDIKVSQISSAALRLSGNPKS